MADIKSKSCHDVQSLDGINEMVGEFNKLWIEIYDRHATTVKKCIARSPASELHIIFVT